jgi:drug/metabolite transporter (DMT)-like permease
MTKPDRITLWLLAVLLVAYAFEKYIVAAPPVFIPGYAVTVAIIFALTGFVPAIALWQLRRKLPGLSGHAALMIGVAVGLSALGYALFWYFSIGGSPGAPPLEALAVRGVRPGLCLAAVMILGRWLDMRRAI